MLFFNFSVLDHTKVTYKINCPDMSHYPRADLEELRESVALLTNAQFDDVLVCGVRNGCVIVTFMIRNCLIPTLRAFYLSEKQTMAFHGELKHKIINVTIKDDVLYMPGTFFLFLQENNSRSLYDFNGNNYKKIFLS